MKINKSFIESRKEIKTNYKESWLLFWKYYKQNKKWTITLAILSLLTALITISLPFLSQLIDLNAADSDWNHLITTVSIIALIAIVRIIIFYISNYMADIFNVKIETQIREEMMEKIHHLSMETFDNAPIGIFFSRFFSDLQDVRKYASRLIQESITIICLMIGGFAFVFYVNWIVGLVIFTVYLITLIIYVIFKQNLVYHQQYNKTLATFMSIGVGEHVQMVSEIKSFSNSLTTVEKFDAIQNNYYNSIKKFIKKSTFFNWTGVTASILISTVILIMGAILLNQNKINSSELLGLVVASNILIIPIEKTASLAADAIVLNANIVRIKEFHGWKFENEEGSVKKHFEGDIEFRNVTFSYRTKENTVPVFNNFNISIPKNSRTLLHSDGVSGLTTIFKLLMRYYEVDSGEILLDGINIKDYNIEYLRKNITYQAFSPKLFSSSLELESLYPDTKRYNSIIQSLGIEELIKKKEILDKNINSQGLQISDSEKQMLSIARGLYFDTFVILFDFPESCLNKEQLSAIDRTLKIFAKNKTIIFNSHDSNSYFDIDNYIEI
ncbi:MAG: ABC transporter transmembrane domain-containing protein [Metamycoplasmataceae bacterium]